MGMPSTRVPRNRNPTALTKVLPCHASSSVPRGTKGRRMPGSTSQFSITSVRHEAVRNRPVDAGTASCGSVISVAGLDRYLTRRNQRNRSTREDALVLWFLRFLWVTIESYSIATIYGVVPPLACWLRLSMALTWRSEAASALSTARWAAAGVPPMPVGVAASGAGAAGAAGVASAGAAPVWASLFPQAA